jgi:hypothetical protein
MNDRKQPSMDSEKAEAMLTRPSRPRRRPLLTGFAAVVFCFLVWPATTKYNVFHRICGQHSITPVTINQERALVPLEAHIMSKCPDAKVGSTRCLEIIKLTSRRIASG